MKVLEEALDDEQRVIALAAGEENVLVFAGPGSGKTRLLTHLAAYQVRRSEPARTRVLCITFSVEATRVMRSRLRSPSMELKSPSRLHVANFHQLSLELLGAYGDRIGWPRNAAVIGANEAEELLHEIITTGGPRGLTARNARNAISRLRNARPQDPGLATPAESLARLADAYDARKRELAVRDFDDLIGHAVGLLRDDDRVREHVRRIYRHIVVDELQDTSGLQLELVGLLADPSRTRVCGVADDDQMIYAWRDARPENLLEFEQRFVARRAALLGNYRCPPAIVQAANAVIGPNRTVGEGDRLAYSRVTDRQGVLEVVRLTPFDNEPETVARVVGEEIDLGVPAAKIAVLSPVRYRLEHIRSSLSGWDIPSVEIGDDSAANEPLARVLEAGFALQAAPEDPRAGARLARRLADAGYDENEAAEVERRLVASLSPEESLAVVADALGAPPDDPKVLYVRRVIHAARREQVGSDARALGSRLRLEWTRLDAQVKHDERSVKLMTTFGAKGLEFHTVVLPHFSSEEMPHRPRGVVTDDAWWREERRKAYVSLTRAEQKVVFIHSGPPSQFLTSIPADLLTERRLR